MRQKYDSVSKFVMFEYTEDIAKLILGNVKIVVLNKFATEHLTLKTHHNDGTFEVQLPDGTPFILHIEVQTHDSQKPMPLRIAAYQGLLLHEYEHPVYSCVIYLHPNAGRTDTGYYAYQVNEGEYRIRYKVIRLIEIDGQAILKAQDPGLLPLTPLMKPSDQVDANGWLDECVNAIRTANITPSVRDELLAAAAIFGGLVYNPQQIKQRIPEAIMRESSVVQSYMEEAKVQGHQEGLQKGRQEGLQEGRQEGLQEGHQEGLQEGTEQTRTAIAISMLNDNQPIDTIIKYTGLSKAEIEQLAASARISTQRT